MVRVPQLPAAPQVGVARLPGPRINPNVSPEAFGASGGRIVGAIVAEEREKADKAAVTEAATALRQWAHDQQYNPETGYRTLGAQDLFSYSAGASQEISARKQELLQGLSGRARELAAPFMADIENTYLNGLGRYELGKRNEYYSATNAASAESLIQEGAAWAQEPGAFVGEVPGTFDFARVDRNADMLYANRASFAESHPDLLGGLEQGQWVEAAYREDITRMHEATLGRLAAQEDDVAVAAYVERYGPDMTAQARARWEASSGRMSELGDIERLGDELMADFPVYVGGDRPDDAPTPTAQRRALLAKVGDRARAAGWSDEKQAESEDKIGRRFDQMHRAAELEQQELFDLMVERGADQGYDTDALQRNYPVEWARMTPTQRDAMEALEAKEKDGVKEAISNATYVQMREMRAYEHEKWLEFPLPLIQGKVSDDLYRKLEADKKADMEGRSDLLNAGRSQLQQTEGALAQMGLVTRAGMSDSSRREVEKRANAFHVQVGAAVGQKQVELGRPLTNAEHQKVVDGLMREAITLPSGESFPLGARAFEANPDTLDLDDVPVWLEERVRKILVSEGEPSDRDAIEARLIESARRGVTFDPPTEEELAQARVSKIDSETGIEAQPPARSPYHVIPFRGL